MSNKEQAETFLKWVSDHYSDLTVKYQKWSNNRGVTYDEDIFSETYLKVYDKILRDGIKDNTPEGYDNYMFRAFSTNTKRESQYSRNRLRDMNIKDDEIMELYERYAGEDVSKEKLMSDLYKDFSVIYLMKKAEEHFPQEQYNLFKLKYLCNLTYKQLREKTNTKSAKDEVSEVKNWLKDNVSKDEVRQEFNDVFSSLF